MNKRHKTVCFSGHRILQEASDKIESRTEIAVRECISNGAERFICGGALGFDTLAAHIIIRLRKEFQQIKLVLALPCPPAEQTLKWSKRQKAEYEEIREQADEVLILSDCYTESCMLDRNRYMVDNSDILIYYMRNSRGGTAYTVRYAKKSDILLKDI